MKRRVAIIGTQGLPSKYGGFETLVYYLVLHLSSNYDITVYCSGPEYEQRLDEYLGARLRYVPLRANGFQSIPYDILSIVRACWRHDKVLILGSSGAIILPILWFYKRKFIINFGGLDWKRSKWSKFAQTILRVSERLAIRHSSQVISDNQAIQTYIKNTYGKESTLIAYGGDQATKISIKQDDILEYPFLTSKYAFSLARIQSDNNIELILKAFDENMNLPLVFVGNWNSSEYGRTIKGKYEKVNGLVLLDAIYDQNKLNLLRSNCFIYIHGHSAGGTNPALVEAMNLALPVFCFSSGFNEFTTESNAIYFNSSSDLREKIQNSSLQELALVASRMLEIAAHRYCWKDIAQDYAEIFDK